jgi:hypothetical protein
MQDAFRGMHAGPMSLQFPVVRCPCKPAVRPKCPVRRTWSASGLRTHMRSQYPTGLDYTFRKSNMLR